MTKSDQDGLKILQFFFGVQKKIYVESQDSKNFGFYRSICRSSEIDFKEFSSLFESPEIKAKTVGEFNIAHNWGVMAYPILILSDGEKL